MLKCNEFIFRNMDLSDLDNLMQLEESWPESERATRKQLEHRIRYYQEGCWLLESLENHKIVGSITGFPCYYGEEQECRFQTWHEVTNSGFFPESFDENADAFYIASSVVDSSYQGKGLFVKMVKHFMNYVDDQLNLKWILGGVVIPGYDSYCLKYGEIPAVEYVLKQQGKRPIDPFLRRLHELGFTVPNANYVKENYYPDEPSRNYAAIVAAKL